MNASDPIFRRQRRQFSFAAIAALGGAAWHKSAQAQAWPSKPITVIVPAGTGAPIDTVARMLAPAMGAALGQPLVVKNVTGGGGTIGLAELARAPKDGHTIGFISVPLAITPALYKLPYDTERDILAVSILSRATMVVAVNAKVQAGNIKDLLALAQTRAGAKPVAFGTPAPGSLGHLAFEMLKQETGAPFLHVPYRTNDAMMAALISGEIDAAIPSLSATVPLVKSDYVRIVGIASDQRTKAYPAIPTLVQQGVKTGEYDAWVALIMPSGAPQAVVDKINATANAAMSDPRVGEKLEGMGYDTLGTTSAQAQSVVRRDTARFAEVIKKNAIKAD